MRTFVFIPFKMLLPAILLMVSLVQGGNILGIFPCPSKSHTILVSALFKELAKRGHNVTLYSPHITENKPENFTNVLIEGVVEEYHNVIKVINNPLATTLFKWKTFAITMSRIVERVIKSADFLRLINQEPKFDLILQYWMMTESLLIMGHKHNASTIAFATGTPDTYQNLIFNNPVPYAYVPNAYLPLTDEMSFMQRFINTMANILPQFTTALWHIPKQKKMLYDTFPDSPDLDKLMDNVDIMFVNTHILLESPRPYLPNVIQIGGFHLYGMDDLLSDDIKKFLDNSSEGVIYCNFGTNLNNFTISPKIQNTIKRAFTKSKYKIVYKFDGEWINKPKNIFTSKWFPQSAVLAHHNVKVFITHGGNGGINEGLFHGVPMLGIPFCFDQAGNVAKIVKKKWAVELNPHSFNEDDLERAIEELLTNPEYAVNVQAASKIFRNSQPMETAIQWVEYMARYKNAKYLKSKGSSMPWYQYMLVDIFAFITFIIILIIFMMYFTIKYMYFTYKKLCRNKENKDKKL